MTSTLMRSATSFGSADCGSGLAELLPSLCCPGPALADALAPNHHQALMHVVVNLICIEVWMVKDHLYQIFQFCCIDIVLTNVFLQNVFAP